MVEESLFYEHGSVGPQWHVYRTEVMYIDTIAYTVVCVKLTCVKLTHFPKFLEPLACVKLTQLPKFLEFLSNLIGFLWIFCRIWSNFSRIFVVLRLAVKPGNNIRE